jgi:hypothetical protein
MIALLAEERERLMLEYSELLNEILQRRQTAWLIHSILLASTFIISFTAHPELYPFPYIISLILVIASWFLQITVQIVNDSCWRRRREIETILDMLGPRRRYETLQRNPLYRIRHYLWHFLWLFLFLLYLYLSINYSLAL